MDLSYWNICVF